MQASKKFLIFIVGIVVASSILGITIANNGESKGYILENGGFELQEGKNYLYVSQPVFVKDFVTLNPQIVYVSYHDAFLNKDFGYINFGDGKGIGKNFLMQPGRIYEVWVDEPTILEVAR